MDSTDWVIAGAEIAITLDGSSVRFPIVTTGKDGSYQFNNLSAGNYSVTILTPASVPGTDDGQWRTIMNASSVVSRG